MDGLLRSGFALVLRDSLNSTPRRHVNAGTSSALSPPPTPSPSPPLKKPRSAADFGIHCNMQLEARLPYMPFPTSPTTPPIPTTSPRDIGGATPSSTRDRDRDLLPSAVVKLAALLPDLQSPQPPPPPPPQAPQPSSSSSHLRFRDVLRLGDDAHPAISPVLSSTSAPSGLVPSFSCLPLRPPSPLSSSCSAMPLDVLASVSAEQCVNATATAVPVGGDAAVSAATVTVTVPSSRLSRGEACLQSSAAGTGPSDSRKKKGMCAPSRVARTLRKKSGNGTGTTGSGVSGTKAVAKSFRCAQCPSTFSQQFNLNKHVRAVHERRRPFQCQVCHARFQQKSHRRMHHLAVHEKLRQFACDQCTSSFSWRGVLKKHRKSIHGIDE